MTGPPKNSPASAETFSNPVSHRAHTGRLWAVGTLTYTTGGLAALFFWLLWGDFAWSLKERAVPPIIQLLFKKSGASDLLAGILVGSLPAIIAIAVGPVISYLSDRHRGRWGRRIPFLLIPTPIAVVAMIGLAFSTQIGDWFQDATHFWSTTEVSTLFFLALFWTLFEFASITANSIFGGLVNDVVPQEVIGRFYGLFRALSLIAGIIFNFWILGLAEIHYAEIFVALALLYGIGFSLMCFRVREGQYPPPPEPVASGTSGNVWRAVKTYASECFGTPYYVLFFLAFSLAGAAFNPVNLYSVFYAMSVGLDMQTYGSCFALMLIVSLVLAYPLGVCADRFHPLRIVILVLSCYAVSSFFSAWLVKDGRTFSVAFIVHGVLSGTYFTVSASLAQRLLPATRFAELNSAGGIIVSIVSILIPLLMGTVLDYSNHAYNYTFLVGGIFAMLAVGFFWMLHGKFMRYGGVTRYTPPPLKSFLWTDSRE